MVWGENIPGFHRRQLTVELPQDTSWQPGGLILSNSDDIEVKFASFSKLPLLKVLSCNKIVLFLIDVEKSSSLISQKFACD